MSTNIKKLYKEWDKESKELDTLKRKCIKALENEFAKKFEALNIKYQKLFKEFK